jgi:hypothetical protein
MKTLREFLKSAAHRKFRRRPARLDFRHRKNCASGAEKSAGGGSAEIEPLVFS